MSQKAAIVPIRQVRGGIVVLSALQALAPMALHCPCSASAVAEQANLSHQLLRHCGWILLQPDLPCHLLRVTEVPAEVLAAVAGSSASVWSHRCPAQSAVQYRIRSFQQPILQVDSGKLYKTPFAHVRSAGWSLLVFHSRLSAEPLAVVCASQRQ